MNQETLIIKMVSELNRNFKDYDDGCGDINCTLLAENIANEYDLCEDDAECTIPEEVFDAAVLASEKYKNQRKPTVKMGTVRPRG